MVTVQHIVKKELLSNPVLVDMLDEELLNVSAVALRLQPNVEKELDKKIKLSAISMAIRRFTDTTSLKRRLPQHFPKNLEISTKSQIFEIAIEKTSKAQELLKKINQHIKRYKGDFISIVEGTYELVIFTNQSKKQIVKNILKNQKMTSELDNLGYVTVNWGKVTKDISGIYYLITRALAFKGISIQSFHTIGSEMMIFFKEEVFIDAYKVIANLLKNNKHF